jgi:hypothetical protein
MLRIAIDRMTGRRVSAGLTLTALAGALPAHAGGPPPNDACANATEITLGSTIFPVAGATDEPDGCGSNLVWFRFTAPCSGLLFIEAESLPTGNTIAIYSPNVLGGCACPPGGGAVGGGQVLNCGSDFASAIVTLGRCYIISVSNPHPDAELETLALWMDNYVNDHCADAHPIGQGETPFCTFDATGEGPTTPCGEIEKDVWFEYVAECTGNLTASVCDQPNFTTSVVVYGPGPAGFSCPGGDPPFSGVLLGCAIEPSSGCAEVTVSVIGGLLYKIRVGDLQTFGPGLLTLTNTLPNDGCPGATVIGVGDTPFCTLSANEGGAENDCPEFADPGPDIWFRHTAECTGTLVVSTCNQANFNTKLAIYEGCGVVPPFFFCNLDTLLACNDNDIFCPGGTSRLSVPVTEGTCYRIRLGSANNESGTGTLTLSYVGCTPPEPCPADDSGTVDVDDLIAVILGWGACGNCQSCQADVDDSCAVDVDDLIAVILAWGACP